MKRRWNVSIIRLWSVDRTAKLEDKEIDHNTWILSDVQQLLYFIAQLGSEEHLIVNLGGNEAPALTQYINVCNETHYFFHDGKASANLLIC